MSRQVDAYKQSRTIAHPHQEFVRVMDWVLSRPIGAGPVRADESLVPRDSGFADLVVYGIDDCATEGKLAIDA